MTIKLSQSDALLVNPPSKFLRRPSHRTRPAPTFFGAGLSRVNTVLSNRRKSDGNGFEHDGAVSSPVYLERSRTIPGILAPILRAVTEREDAAGIRVGIDLGTTNSLVACLIDGEPIVVPNTLGERLTPSAVSLTDDGTIVIGRAAKARQVTAPTSTVCDFKRDMGSQRTWTLGGQTLRPEELSAMVLRDLREHAERHFGAPVLEAVVTVPAYFGEEQRRATQAACEIAGLRVERIINEPTAAALAFGFGQPDQERRLVVLDLGGGTFDVSVLDVTDGVIEIQGTAGDARLGGEDFVDVMMAQCDKLLTARGAVDLQTSPVREAKLRSACERAKRQLSRTDQASVVVPDVGPSSETYVLALTRSQVHTWWKPLLERMREPVHRALRDAGWMRTAVQDVLLVGGATRMPIIDEFVRELFERDALRSLQPDEAVGVGAAIQAALKADDAQVEDLVVTDIAPFSLGVERSAVYGSHRVSGLFSPILERGTVLPASRSDSFITLDDDQTRVSLAIYQGERALCQENTKIGEFTIEGLPAGPAGSVEVEVRFTYDLNGVLEVETTVVDTDDKQVVVFDRSQGGMSEAEIERSRRAMASLKLHPRETLPNTTALEQAEALYATLTQEPRLALGEAIAAFRASLETQDPEQVRQFRERLLALLETLRSPSF